MMSGMSLSQETGGSPANTLCKACGLCCTGYLFIWTKLRAGELDSIEELGVPVLRTVPSQRGFNQPCPLWQGQCTIYDTPDYPRFCRTYKCSLLKQVLEENISLAQALTVVEEAQNLIHDLEPLLTASPSPNFRERLAAQVEAAPEEQDPDLRKKIDALLGVYKNMFGVDDLIADENL